MKTATRGGTCSIATIWSYRRTSFPNQWTARWSGSICVQWNGSSRRWWRERSTSRTATWFSSTSSSGTNEQLPNLSTFLSFSLYLSHSKMDSPTARDLGMGSSLQIALATWSLSQAFVMRIVHDKDEKDWLFFGFICAIAVDKYFPCFSLNSIFSYL